jgi:SAM-dependent methyltransferase
MNSRIMLARRSSYLIIVLILFITGCENRKVHKRDPGIIQNPEDVKVSQEYLSEDIGILLKRYEDPTRELWQNPDLVVEKMGSLEGKVVADIGVGTGYFTFKVANEAEKVIAIDIENKFLEYIEDRKFELGQASVVSKIETRLCKSDDPLLRPEEADLAMIIDTYHFIEERESYMDKVHRGLSLEGRVLLVDYKDGDMPVGPPEDMKVPLSTALSELRGAGFNIMEVDTISLQFQYIIMANK